jgi:hypothetical protein
MLYDDKIYLILYKGIEMNIYLSTTKTNTRHRYRQHRELLTGRIVSASPAYWGNWAAPNQLSTLGDWLLTIPQLNLFEKEERRWFRIRPLKELVIFFLVIKVFFPAILFFFFKILYTENFCASLLNLVLLCY